jgi:hypothetical protein
MATIALGDKVKDPITGVCGIVIARTIWMYGCVRITVQPQELKDGRPVENCTIDEPQLEVVERAAIKDIPEWREPARPAAGPRPDVTRQSTPRREGA